MAKNTYTQTIGRIFISVHTRNPPTDEEWERSLTSMQGEGFLSSKGPCTIVFTDGGAPNATQRKRLSETYAGRDIPVAVLSGSLLPRFVNASIALFNKSIRSYGPEELREACEYLLMTSEERQLLLSALTRIQQEMVPEKSQAIERALQSLKGNPL